jgi:uncharacterized protein (DUF1330 family)
MAAYVVVDIGVKEPEGYEEYKRLAQESIAQYGGRYLVRGGKTEVLEGEWPVRRFVLLEFPDGATAREWWSSPEYERARRVREATAEANMLLVE